MAHQVPPKIAKQSLKAQQAFALLVANPGMTNIELGRAVGLTRETIGKFRSAANWDQEVSQHLARQSMSLLDIQVEEAQALKESILAVSAKQRRALEALWDEYFEEDPKTGKVTIIPHYRTTKNGRERILPHVQVNGFFEAQRKLIDQSYKITGEDHREKKSEKDAGASKVLNFGPLTINRNLPAPVSGSVSKGDVIDVPNGEEEEIESSCQDEPPPGEENHPPSDPGEEVSPGRTG